MTARVDDADAARSTGTALAPGVVIAAHRRHYIVELDSGGTLACVLKGRSLTLACGDRVRVAIDGDGGAIVDIEARQSLFFRSDGFREKLIAANVTQVLGVVAPDIPVDEHLLNRWIIAAETEHCRFVLVLNKSDLPQAPAFASRFDAYAALGYTIVRVAATHNVKPLWPLLEGQHSVVIGQSGMGKSTLINALLPRAAARIGEVSEALRSGRHTTTSTALYRLPADGWIVDSPGMKVFGLAHCTAQTIEDAFVELRALVSRCRFRDCGHDREPGCAVQQAVAEGRVAPQRVLLLRTLLREAEEARDPAR